MNSMVFCHLGPDLKVSLSWLARRATWEIEKVSQQHHHVIRYLRLSYTSFMNLSPLRMLTVTDALVSDTAKRAPQQRIITHSLHGWSQASYGGRIHEKAGSEPLAACS